MVIQCEILLIVDVHENNEEAESNIGGYLRCDYFEDSSGSLDR